MRRTSCDHTSHTRRSTVLPTDHAKDEHLFSHTHRHAAHDARWPRSRRSRGPFLVRSCRGTCCLCFQLCPAPAPPPRLPRAAPPRTFATPLLCPFRARITTLPPAHPPPPPPTVFDVHKTWCGQCKVMEPTWKRIFLDYDDADSRIVFASVASSDIPALEEYTERSCEPLFLLYKVSLPTRTRHARGTHARHTAHARHIARALASHTADSSDNTIFSPFLIVFPQGGQPVMDPIQGTNAPVIEGAVREHIPALATE